ncbi:MAG TPA: Asp-tRNA(Asn)/Glu-tRNA(Gln) amidotransferase subunit GatB [Sedimentisphaerales bacterium]|nr:Asp-tRNA(Asn)/Glu-tRNA(Gln) amidotransferase subunit GatB [Sedimentisphaerales bacterium]
MAELRYKLVVGLEIHVQLATRTKMFCGCELTFGQEPNSRVCPVCEGMPGSLPVMNRQAFEKAVLAALALNCEIPRFTKWDRKHYYYPDLPKNYQISQYDLPLSRNGYIEIPVEGGRTKRVGIIRAHLEEDAGKNMHSGESSQVDLNRAGTPLLEIVTRPDMNSPAEVRELAQQLQRIVRYLGVSEADMQKGHMRFEPNVNLVITRDGREYKTPIAEIKNLNSFRAIERSVEYEIQRQLDEFAETGRTMEMGNKSTRGWDDIRGETILQREKEEAHDYRYMPDPDLAPTVMTDEWRDEIRSRLCELPLAREQRFSGSYGLSEYDAGVLTLERATADFFDAAVLAGGNPKRVCNLLTQTGLKLANDRGCSVAELGFSAEQLAELTKLAEAGTVSATAAAAILEELARDASRSALEIAQAMNLVQKSDAAELETVVEEVVKAHPQAVADSKDPKKGKKAMGFLMGEVIKRTKGQANPRVVSEILGRKLA